MSDGSDKLPHPDDLCELPRWAIAFFATRCVRRVLPLYPRALHEQVAIEHAVEHVEKVVESRGASADQAETLIASGAVTAASQVLRLRASHHREGTAAATCLHICGAAVDMIATARCLKVALRTSTEESPTRGTIAAACCALSAASSSILAAHAAQASEETASAIRSDYDALVRMSRVFLWSDNSPISVECLCTLWPRGEPWGWLDAVKRFASRTIEEVYTDEE